MKHLLMAYTSSTCHATIAAILSYQRATLSTQALPRSLSIVINILRSVTSTTMTVTTIPFSILRALKIPILARFSPSGFVWLVEQSTTWRAISAKAVETCTGQLVLKSILMCPCPIITVSVHLVRACLSIKIFKGTPPSSS